MVRSLVEVVKLYPELYLRNSLSETLCIVKLIVVEGSFNSNFGQYGQMEKQRLEKTREKKRRKKIEEEKNKRQEDEGAHNSTQAAKHSVFSTSSWFRRVGKYAR